jgi:hypothetical protein
VDADAKDAQVARQLATRDEANFNAILEAMEAAERSA